MCHALLQIGEAVVPRLSVLGLALLGGKVTAPLAGQCPAPTPMPELVVSASRLKKIGGEKDTPGCERRYAAEYLFDMRQSGSAATELGKEVHFTAEVFQETGEVPDAESDAGTIFRSAMHLINVCGKLQVEYEHRGYLPDGTPYVARMDGASDPARITPELRVMVCQDLKTTSNKRYALNEDRNSSNWLGADMQAMKYAWILLCDVHWFAKALPEGHQGPLQWQVWDPAKMAGGKGLRECRLRWLYMLTKGLPKAWDVNVFVTPAEAEAFMHGRILPWVAKMKALHTWRAANPTAGLNEIDRTLAACKGIGQWCGAGERNACVFSATGTPINDLIQLKRKPMTNIDPKARLAALKAQMAGKAAAPTSEVAAAPATPKDTPVPAAAPEPAPTPSAPSTASGAGTPADPATGAAAPAADAAPAAEPSVASAPASGRGRPRGSRNKPKAPADAGSGVNPPEVKEAIEKINAAVEGKVTAPISGTTEVDGRMLTFTGELKLSDVPVEELLAELVRRVLAVGVGK